MGGFMMVGPPAIMSVVTRFDATLPCPECDKLVTVMIRDIPDCRWEKGKLVLYGYVEFIHDDDTRCRV